jgi:hypothetical protein
MTPSMLKADCYAVLRLDFTSIKELPAAIFSFVANN